MPNVFESDFEMACYTAMAMLGVSPMLDCRFENFSSLKATARLKGNILECRASIGFAAAPQDALTGLALHLLSRVYRRTPDGAGYYLRAYKEFVTRESTSRLNSSIRRLKPQKLNPAGAHFNLSEVLARVKEGYVAVLEGVETQGISWSRRLGRRVLAFHDESFNTVWVNDSFDSQAVPLVVLDYLVFHELLHAKHGARFQRGESLRKMVHTGAFRVDERKFAGLKEAESWLDANWRRLSRR